MSEYRLNKCAEGQAINAQKNLVDGIKLYQEDMGKGATVGTLPLVCHPLLSPNGVCHKCVDDCEIPFVSTVICGLDLAVVIITHAHGKLNPHSL